MGLEQNEYVQHRLQRTVVPLALLSPSGILREAKPLGRQKIKHVFVILLERIVKDASFD